MKKVIVIVGPTATGKSGLSVKLAKTLHTDVINGDSVQVYRKLDIGSAKLKPHEMDGVKHHLIDIRDVNENYSVYHFQQDARALIETLDIPIISGGTGLYIKATLYDYIFDDPERNNAFEEAYKNYSTEDIAALVKSLDPNINIDEMNRRRLLRALAMAKAGKPRSSKMGKDTPLYDALILYLDMDRDLLEKRLEKRLEAMFEEGFLEEAKMLFHEGIKINAIGYREMDQYLDGLIDLEQAKKDIVKNSRRLAKKQKTWFLNQMHAVILDATDDALFDTALNHVNAFLKGV